MEMDSRLVEHVAETLWNKWQSDPANQYKVLKRYGKISWQQINALDTVPNLANQYRDKARVAIKSMRVWIAANCHDTQSMLDLFIEATTNGE